MKLQLISICSSLLAATSILAPINVMTAKKSYETPILATELEEKKVELISPINNDTVDILKPKVVNYINAMYGQAKDIEDDQVLHDFYVMAPDANDRYYGVEFTNDTDFVRIADYASNSSNIQKSKKIVLTFTGNDCSPNKVKVSLNEDMTDAVEFTDITNVENAYYTTINQLYAGKTYYWQVFEDNTALSDIASFKTKEGFRMINTTSVTNVRDMGGRTVHLKTGTDENGKNVYNTKHIKQGLIYRGGELVNENYKPEGSSTHSATLKTGDAELLVDELGIAYEIDFRGAAESNNLTESALKTYYSDNYEETRDIDYLRLDNMSAYDDFFSITSSKTYYSDIRTMFLAFANAENKPVYFHCWGGADRTGTCGFLLGALLGMSLTDLVIDYELTSFSGNYRPHNKNDASKVYRFPSMLRKITLLKNTSTNETYWSDDKPLSQIIEEILIDRFNLTSNDISSIRANLLED